MFMYIQLSLHQGLESVGAAACGCALVASEGMPVEEVITNGVEGVGANG